MFLVYVFRSFTIKNYEENRYRADVKKVDNLWNSIQKFCKNLSFQKFGSVKIDPPQKMISSIKTLFNLGLTQIEI